MRNIEEVYELLKKISDKGEELIRKDELEPISEYLKEKSYLSPDIPRIMLMGEFKAGKSTLLNALVKQNIAATDTFEMTSWIARYWYSEKPFCKITLNNGEINDDMHPEEFLKKCQAREISPDELKEIKRVDIGLNIAEFADYSIIDTPGFGSIRSENERRMIDALPDADFTLWALSCEAIGGMKEGAIVEKVKESGMPIACVLTKCDYLDGDEQEDIIDYVEGNNGIKRENIFPVSALDYLNNPSDEKASAEIERLKKFIKNGIVVRSKEVRKQSENSAKNRIEEHCAMLLKRVQGYIENGKKSHDKYTSLVKSVKKGIDMQIENKLSKHVEETLYEPYRHDIAAKISVLSKNDRNESGIQRVFGDVLPENYMENYINELLSFLQEEMTSLWREGLQKTYDEMISFNSELLKASGVNGSYSLVSVDKEQFVEINQKNTDHALRDGLITSVGAAGLASLYLAGASGGMVTAGMALSTIGLPIVIGGLAVAGILKYAKSKKEESNGVDGNKIVDSSVKEFIDKVIKKDYIKRVKTVNENYCNTVIEENKKKFCEKMPFETMTDGEKEIARMLK